MSTSTAITSMTFRGAELDLVPLPTDSHGGTHGAVFRRLCDAVGVNHRAQLNRLKRAAATGARWACVSIMETQAPGDDQRRGVAVLPIRSIPMWAATIDASRVRADRRAALVAYQNLEAEVLARVLVDGAEPSPDAVTLHGRHDLAGSALVQAFTQTIANAVAPLRAEIAELRARLDATPPARLPATAVDEAQGQALGGDGDHHRPFGGARRDERPPPAVARGWGDAVLQGLLKRCFSAFIQKVGPRTCDCDAKLTKVKLNREEHGAVARVEAECARGHSAGWRGLAPKGLEPVVENLPAIRVRR